VVIRSRSNSESRRHPRRAARRRASGATSLQILVLLTPVIFGFMGFAVDLGRLYMIRGELQTAANAIALAAATQLIGTEQALTEAQSAADRARSEVSGFQNRFDYGGIGVGETEGQFTSTVETPQFFETAEAALGTGEGGAGAGDAGGTTARFVRVDLVADAPTVFWRFLALGQEGRTQIRVRSVAGMSAPLCTACGIDPLAIAALDSSDTDNFGFTAATRYTFGYVCNGNQQPQPLAGTTQRLPYLIINRLNEEAQIFADEQTQGYRIGAGGLPAAVNEAVACLRVDQVETVWASGLPLGCAAPGNNNRVPPIVQAYLCGMATRFETGVYAGCESIPEVETATQAFTPDADVTDLDEYSAYTGTGRRILTVPIVDSIADPAAMTILGFRQFLVEPVANTTNINPADTNGRFVVLYLGNVAPIRQGRFSGCSITAGPGKVVLH